MDIADAQSLFGGAGTLHRIGVTAAEGADLPALAARIEDRLGGRADAVTPSGAHRPGAGAPRSVPV